MMTDSVSFRILILFLSLSIFSYANTTMVDDDDDEDCDTCGCSVSSALSGLQMNDHSNFFGVVYLYQRYKSTDGLFINSPVSTDNFHTTQLIGKKVISKRISVSAVVPYHNFKTQSSENSLNINGLGDISFYGWYNIPFKKKIKDPITEKIKKIDAPHSLQLAAGIKIPTGEFENRLTSGVVNPGFQLGTGSLDPSLTVAHNFKSKSWNWNSTATFTYKTENKNEYKFGNQFDFSSVLRYHFFHKNLIITPVFRASAEFYEDIEQFGEKIRDINGTYTDGYAVNLGFGGEVNIGRFDVGANFNLPIAQDLFDGRVDLKHRTSVFLSWKF